MTSDKWLSIQSRFGKNKIDKTRKHEIGILKGIVKCKCGYTMHVQHKEDKIYNRVYDNYFCQNRNRRGKEFCDLRMVPVADLDKAIIKLLKEISFDKNLLNQYIKKENSVFIPRTKNDIQKEISDLTSKIENLTEILQDNTESVASKYVIAKIEELDKKISGLKFELR